VSADVEGSAQRLNKSICQVVITRSGGQSKISAVAFFKIEEESGGRWKIEDAACSGFDKDPIRLRQGSETIQSQEQAKVNWVHRKWV
jgi:hypothetical protein